MFEHLVPIGIQRAELFGLRDVALLVGDADIDADQRAGDAFEEPGHTLSLAGCRHVRGKVA